MVITFSSLNHSSLMNIFSKFSTSISYWFAANRWLMCALLISTNAGAAIAAEPKNYTIFRNKSSLQLVKRSDGGKEGYFAEFQGRVRISGKLAIAFDRDPKEDGPQDTVGEAFFLPDARSRVKLPEAIGKFHPAKIEKIALDKKPLDLLLPLVGAQKTDLILSGKMPNYEIPAEITISKFTAWVDCDHRGYSAKVETIHQTRRTFTSQNKKHLTGC
jgi:hypothetical protein